MRTIISIAVLLLFGSGAAAQNIYDPVGKPSVTFLPSTTNPRDRSITVFEATTFDLDTEVPFRVAPRLVKPAADARLFALSQYQHGVTVVEDCPMLQVEPGLFRHPQTLEERLNPECVRYGYTKPSESEVAAQKKAAPQRRARGQGSR